MGLQEQLLAYKKMNHREPQEMKVQETIQKSMDAFLVVEQERMLSYHEFLWAQWKLVKKRWWLLQLLLLLLLGAVQKSSYEDAYMQRGMGVMASVFVILIIPELWKNRSCHCMEIEETSYYSLRQIYAARMVLFGMVDVSLISVFCTTMVMGCQMEFTKLLVQFLLPMLVAACICFGALCSRHIVNEAMAVILCVLWCAAWLMLVLNKEIYRVVTLPAWLACVGISLVFLGVAVWRSLNNYDCYWEVGTNETGA